MTQISSIKLQIISMMILFLGMITGHAEVSVIWDFKTGDDNGWTTVNGAAWLASGGLEAGQENGIGGNATGATRRAHDGAHTNFIARSPTLNFSTVHPTDPVLEFDLFGGDGNQEGLADPASPAAIISGGTGITSAAGQKGVALLNLTTGNYDAAYYRSGNASAAQVFSLTLDDLTAAGVTTTANYQIDFFENDDGGWGWSRLDEVRLDSNAIISSNVFNIFWDFSDGAGGDNGWETVNGFAGFSPDGVHASQDGTNFAEDAAHPVFLFRSPIVKFTGGEPDDPAIEIDFIGGQGNQAGVSDPVGPGEVIAYNGGASDSNGLKGLAFFNQATGVYDHVVYDSQNGGDSPESITLTVAELEGGGIDLDENYRLDFFDHDDGASGWTRLESVNLLGAVIADPPPPGDLGVVWNFLNGNENGWTTVNGASWLDANGVEAGQADGVGGNDTGATRRAHDGAHTNFIYRSPMVNFGNVASEGAVVEIDFQGATGNQEGAADPLNPQVIIDSGTGITSAVGQKGLGLLNLSTGSYDAVYYKAANGSGTATISLSRDDLNVGGIDFNASYQLDFFDNDDGGWGWTRMQEVRLDSAALGESSSEIAITGIHFSAVDNQLSLTWNSTENTTYAVKYSVDLIDWSSDLDDAVSAGPGSETTRVFDLGGAGLQGERKVFFRVERQPPG